MGGYFDNNATTPLDPRVLEAMLPWLREQHGNPSSAHAWGRQAKDAVERARRQVADLLGGRPLEVVFTSSGSEANTAVIRGLAERAGCQGRLVLSTLEHPSVSQAAARMGQEGMEVVEVPPSADGVVSAARLAEALTADTRLVCLMRANNELGTLQPVAEVAAAARRLGVPVLTDAVQAVGKVPVDVQKLGVDYLTIGGHKFHGPLGIAALWVREGAPLPQLICGGGQEAGRRPSTENVPAIVGLGKTAELAAQEEAGRAERLESLRQRLEEGLRQITGAEVHCPDSPRLPHTCHVAFHGCSGYQLMLRLDEAGWAVSTGSACHAGEPQPSATLLAMGVSRQESLASLRISFGITNTEQEVDSFLRELGEVLVAEREHRAAS